MTSGTRVPAVDVPAGLAGAARRASSRVPYHRLLRVELGRLVGTRSARIVLVVGVAFDVLVLMMVLGAAGMHTSSMVSAYGQVRPALITLHFSQFGLHGVLIMLVAGEWQHRSTQATLLVQPSRLRHLSAQAGAAGLLWLACTVLHLVLFLVVGTATADRVNAVAILVRRPAWTVLVVALESLAPVVVALLAAALFANIAAAFAVYVGLVPLMLIPELAMPAIIAWVDPAGAGDVVADATITAGPWSGCVSALLWVVLAVVVIRVVSRRDVA